MHIEARLEASRRPSPTPRLRRASRANASPLETSAETLDDPWPLAGLRRPRPRAADPLRRSEEHHRRADARPRHASRGTATTRRLGAAPRRAPHRADPAPPDPSRDPSSDPSTPPRSEDHRDASRACLRAPGPHRSTNHATAPRRAMKRGRWMRRGPAPSLRAWAVPLDPEGTSGVPGRPPGR